MNSPLSGTQHAGNIFEAPGSVIQSAEAPESRHTGPELDPDFSCLLRYASLQPVVQKFWILLRAEKRGLV